MKQVKQNLLTFWEKYKHLSILSYFVVYLLWFAYVEKTVTSHFHVIHMALDDVIPFCEYFIIPYLLWFAYVTVTVLYFAFFVKNILHPLSRFSPRDSGKYQIFFNNSATSSGVNLYTVSQNWHSTGNSFPSSMISVSSFFPRLISALVTLSREQ